MTVPNDDLTTLLNTVRRLFRKLQRQSSMRLVEFAIEAGVSPSTMSTIIRYPKYRPGRHVETQLRNYLDTLKQGIPEECSEQVKSK